MANFAFWSSLALVLPQALWVRSRTPRFRGPNGPLSGSYGNAHSLRVFGIGDSIIAGVGASRPDATLTATLALALHQRLGIGVAWSAFGKIAADTRRITGEVARCTPPDGADLILISAGVNDITGLRTRSAWLESMEALVAALVASCPRAQILIVGLPPLELFPALPAPLSTVLGWRARYFEAAIAKRARECPNVEYVSIEIRPTGDDFASDGFHPSEHSYATLGSVLAQRVLDNDLLRHIHNGA
jgi:lysophospholipase L1-like esterase